MFVVLPKYLDCLIARNISVHPSSRTVPSAPYIQTLIRLLQISRDSVPLSLIKEGAEHQDLCRIKSERNKRGAEHRDILSLNSE